MAPRCSRIFLRADLFRQHRFQQMRLLSNKPCFSQIWLCASLLTLLLSSCSSLLGPDIPTPLPAEYLPTAIALTLEAAQPSAKEPPPTALPADPGQTATSTATATPTSTLTATPFPKPSNTPSGPSATPYTLPPPPSPTATPQIPNAEIEIRNLGPLSKIVSPLHIYAYLKPGAGGKVRLELLGEDNRILARKIKVMDFVPVGAWAVMSLDLDFEISATAEAARLKISVDDEYGRTVALNSFPLILLSIGDPDIIPPMDVLAPIMIQEPTKKTLIQGGKLVVSGLVRPENDQPLLVQLITSDGKQVGMRLASISEPGANGYRSFSAEVPYTIANATKALLVVSEGGATINDAIHLSSLEVILSP